MILIVDDKSENIFSLKSILELNRFDVDTATSGEEALKKILKHSYDLIILDVQMPGMDGFEVAEALSGYSKAKDIPIIFLSAVNTEKRFITKGYSSGAIDYITKPVDPDILLLKVKTFKKLYEQRRILMEMQLTLQEEVEIRKKAQRDLNTKVKELQSILESIPQIAFTATPDGAIEFANEHWFGYSDKTDTFPEVHPADHHVCDNWKAHIMNQESFVSEVRIKHKTTAAFRYHLLKVVPVQHDNTIVKWVGTFTDIHEQKIANTVLEHRVAKRTKELIESNKELEARNHELQQFTSVASHDLKEPLRKIQVFSSILKDKYISDQNPDAHFYITRIINSSERMSGLINDLLSYSRLSVNSLFEPTDMESILRDIIHDLEIPIKEKNAEITIRHLPVIEAVPGQMRQVFQNLLSNSLKFSRKDIRPTISVTAEQVSEKAFDAIAVPDGPFCRIKVTDNGIGFNEKYVDRIFTIFQRLNTRESYDGTGIGLAITKKIIEKHNGVITANSTEGEGTIFTIIIPVKQEGTLQPEDHHK